MPGHDKNTELVRRYLGEISAVPLLTREGEVELAMAIQQGEEARPSLEQDDLTYQAGVYAARFAIEYRDTLQDEVIKGEEAHDLLIRANLRLVVSVAKRYCGRGLDLLDLVQEGNLGVMRAVDKFDYQKGFKFSTYAIWWIRQAITRAIADKARTIRVPVHAAENMATVGKARDRLRTEYKREPTAEEITEEIKKLPLSSVREALDLLDMQDMLSLDMSVGENEEGEMYDLLSDRNAVSADEVASRAIKREVLARAILALDERSQKIIRLRFGLADDKPMTRVEIGKEFGVTRERIRQIEERALRRLRADPQLRNFLGEDRL